MKTLALLRHGKSSWDDADVDDFGRGLKDRGRKASRLIGKEIRKRGLAFDLAICSPARRTVQTLDHVQQELEGTLTVRLEPEAYLASPDKLLEIVRAVDDAVGQLLLVGHHPGMPALATALARDDDPLATRIAEHFPTAALAIVELPANHWASVGPGSGTIIDYLKPREL